MMYRQQTQELEINGVKTWASCIVEKDDAGNLVGGRQITFDPEVELTEEELNTYYEQITGEHLETVDERRLKAYQAEADPLFFKWQRGESTQEEWLAKIEEIRERIK